MQIGFVFVCLLAECRVLLGCLWLHGLTAVGQEQIHSIYRPYTDHIQSIDGIRHPKRECWPNKLFVGRMERANLMCAIQAALKYRYLLEAGRLFVDLCECVCVSICVRVSGQIFGHMRRMSNAMMKCDGSFLSLLFCSVKSYCK